MLWANLHLLFWLSLLPFTTGWMGENEFDVWPTVLYGVNLLCCAIAYFILQCSIIAVDSQDSVLARAVGLDTKGKISPFLYLLGIGSAWLIAPWVGIAFFCRNCRDLADPRQADRTRPDARRAVTARSRFPSHIGTACFREM